MAQPTILVPETSGIHNASAYVDRLNKEKSYRDLSTVIICPTRGFISARIVQSWQGMARPMNQKIVGPIFIEGMEVGEAYNSAIRMILENQELNQYKYILTIEEDNSPPPDGLLKLYEAIDEYDAIGGLYWTKGEAGQPMCYGDPAVMPLNFIPQIPEVDMLTPCNGLGMGFTLFRLEMFKDERFEYGKWFVTLQRDNQAFTQDLYFFKKARELGYKFACDSRVRVGHYDAQSRMMW